MRPGKKWQGVGSITRVHDSGLTCAVKWDSGRIDRSLKLETLMPKKSAIPSPSIPGPSPSSSAGTPSETSPSAATPSARTPDTEQAEARRNAANGSPDLPRWKLAETTPVKDTDPPRPLEMKAAPSAVQHLQPETVMLFWTLTCSCACPCRRPWKIGQAIVEAGGSARSRSCLGLGLLL
jgi:hypothetical protein